MQAKRSILCVGKDAGLLTTRCDLLTSEGYFADWASPSNFLQKFRGRPFELVILAASLNREEMKHVRSMIPVGVTALELDRLVFPEELLRLITRVLAGRSSKS